MRNVNTKKDFRKLKVELSRVLVIKATGHEDVWGSGGTAPPSLISALGGDDWSASRPNYFIPRERYSCTQ
jgi:hypothetical protein